MEKENRNSFQLVHETRDETKLQSGIVSSRATTLAEVTRNFHPSVYKKCLST